MRANERWLSSHKDRHSCALYAVECDMKGQGSGVQIRPLPYSVEREQRLKQLIRRNAHRLLIAGERVTWHVHVRAGATRVDVDPDCLL